MNTSPGVLTTFCMKYAGLVCDKRRQGCPREHVKAGPHNWRRLCRAQVNVIILQMFVIKRRIGTG